MKEFETQGKSFDCKPLLDVANGRLYVDNSFRITGLRVDATPRQITRKADELKYLEELGQGAKAHTSAFALNPPPTVEKIREAIARLKDPEKRLIDEFFWFWPEQFGKESTDRALSALDRGDQNEACELWVERGAEPTTGFVARHNLAILYHLVALDWTNYHLAAEVDEERQGKIKWFWTESSKFWKDVAADDRVWDHVKSRIRSLEDARLTTGFARRMEASLPRALGAVNAAVALKFAETGRIEWARAHIRLMGNGNSEDSEKTAEAVLSPVKERLKNHITEAKKTVEKDAKRGNAAARQLIEQVRPQLFLFDLFKSPNTDNHQRNDLLDEVATTCINSLVGYVNATNDDNAFVETLRATLVFAVSADVKQRIERNIEAGERGLRDKLLAPFVKRLETVTAPPAKLALVHQELMPQLADQTRQRDGGLFADGIAEILRQISLQAYNEHADLETALAATSLAIKICKDPALQKRLLDDKAQLRKFEEEEKKHDLHLEIRSDVINVNKAFVRYNGTKLLSDKVTGIRMGIFHQYTNGVQSSCSYFIGIAAPDKQSISIECKRFFRSEEQAKSDYEAILNALYYHVIAPLVARISKSVIAGEVWRVEDCLFQSNGITMMVGLLAWKKPVFIPYSDITYNKANGAINLLGKGGIKKTFEFRTAWNAVILEPVLKAIVQAKS